MKNKLIIKRCLKLLCLLLCLAVLSGFFADLCQYYDHNVLKLEGFYAEPKNSLDVVLLGASEAFTDYSAGYAYDLYGFTSYPYSLDANPGKLYESQLREIRKRQSPQLILVEINGFLYDDSEKQDDAGSIRRYVNNIPISVNWAKTIMDSLPWGQWEYHFYQLARDHGNWKGIYEQKDWIKDAFTIRFFGSKLKGNVSTLNYYTGPAPRNIDNDATSLPMEPSAEAYLRNFLKYCKAEGLEDQILFVRFPHVVSSEEHYARYCRGNEALRIIQESGFDFLNLEWSSQEIGLDPYMDYYNDDHLNYRGQQKLTAYLGKLLVDDYGVKPSDLTQKQKEDWDTAAQYSRRFYELCDEWIDTHRGSALYESSSLMEILDRR